MRIKQALQQLTSNQLEKVTGGGGADALGEALKLGGEGTVKALSQSDAPNITQGINSFNQNYNPVYKGITAAQNYFNPQPGHGAPGDTYTPATQGANGAITGGGFTAPGM
jgi:hypothetical protein